MHTRETVNYQLPQFDGSDKPTWLGDINGAFLAIDAAMHENAGAAGTAQTAADQALSGLVTALERAQTADTKATQAISDAAAAQLTANGAAANAAQALSLIETINDTLSNRTIYHYLIPTGATADPQDPGYYDIPGDDYSWAEAGDNDLWIVRDSKGRMFAMCPNKGAVDEYTEVYTAAIETLVRNFAAINHGDAAALQITACNKKSWTIGDQAATTTVDNTQLKATDLYIIREAGITIVPNA